MPEWHAMFGEGATPCRALRSWWSWAVHHLDDRSQGVLDALHRFQSHAPEALKENRVETLFAWLDSFSPPHLSDSHGGTLPL